MRSTYRALAMPVGMLAVPVVALAYAPGPAAIAPSHHSSTPRPTSAIPSPVIRCRIETAMCGPHFQTCKCGAIGRLAMVIFR